MSCILQSTRQRLFKILLHFVTCHSGKSWEKGQLNRAKSRKLMQCNKKCMFQFCEIVWKYCFIGWCPFLHFPSDLKKLTKCGTCGTLKACLQQICFLFLRTFQSFVVLSKESRAPYVEICLDTKVREQYNVTQRKKFALLKTNNLLQTFLISASLTEIEIGS